MEESHKEDEVNSEPVSPEGLFMESTDEDESFPREEFDQDFAVSWVGPDFVAHEKSSIWYITVFTSSVFLGIIFYLITKDLITSISAFVAIVLVGVYSLRKPKNVEYKVDSDGFSVGTKYFPFEKFRSFRAMPEGIFMNATFIPLKRFSPPVGLCYSGPEEETILNFLATRLPYERYQPDLLERLMLRIRF